MFDVFAMTLANLSVILIMLPVFFRNYELVEKRRATAESTREFLDAQSWIYSNLSLQHLTYLQREQTGFDAVNAAWLLAVHRHMDERTLKTSEGSEGSRLLGFIEGKLEVSVPENFAHHLVTSTWSDEHAIVPSTESEDELGIQIATMPNEHLRIVMFPPSPLTDGYVGVYIDGKKAWQTELWRTTPSTGGRIRRDAISIEASFAKDRNSLFVFGVNGSGFYIAEFDISDGSLIGTFRSLAPFPRN